MEAKVAMITGGASGMGKETAMRFGKQGAKVVIFDLSNNGEDVAKEIGSNAIFVCGDVANEEDVIKALNEAEKAFGKPINVLVNCAGIESRMPVVSPAGAYPYEDFKRLCEVNLFGTFNTCRLGAERMSKGEPNSEGERGVIINTGSTAAHDGPGFLSAYCASKAGVLGMSLPMARDLAVYGIRVVSISPGSFNTPMSPLDEVPDVLKDSLAFPYRIGQVNDYAVLAQQILESPYINGTDVRLDAGMRFPAWKMPASMAQAPFDNHLQDVEK